MQTYSEKYKTVSNLLKDYNQVEVQNFITYCYESEIARGTNGLKNPFFANLTAEKLTEYFNKVKNEGLTIDGKHVTIQKKGITYDYIAYKNKLLLSFPESIIDVQLVYDGDAFDVKNDSGKYVYNHKLSNVFSRTEDQIIGAYCFIKNNRGEFFTLLNRAEIEKHRKVATTDYVWKNWFAEMCLKTIMKKGCRIHFDDVFNTIEEEDNKSYDLEKVNETDIQSEINKCASTEDLKTLWNSLSEQEQTLYSEKLTEKRKELKTLKTA